MAAPDIDHLVYAAPDLDVGVEAITDLLGVRAAPGGSHDGLGTRNALLGLGGRRYLEIIAPDPAQPDPLAPRPFGIDDLDGPRLVSFGVPSTDVAGQLDRARGLGFDGGEVVHLSRRRPDGYALSWTLSYRLEPARDGLVPFLIDWNSAPHPSESLSHDLELIELAGHHPDPDAVRADLAALGAELSVRRADEPALVATIASPRGNVNLT